MKEHFYTAPWQGEQRQFEKGKGKDVHQEEGKEGGVLLQRKVATVLRRREGDPPEGGQFSNREKDSGKAFLPVKGGA